MIKNSSKKNPSGPRPINEEDRARLQALLEERRNAPSTSQSSTASSTAQLHDVADERDSGSSEEDVDDPSDPDFLAVGDEEGEAAEKPRKKKRRALRGGVHFEKSYAVVDDEKKKRNRLAQRKCRAKKKSMRAENRKKPLVQRQADATKNRQLQHDARPIRRSKGGKPKKTFRNWTYEQLQLAKTEYLAAAMTTDKSRGKGLGLRHFAEKFGIPKATLHDAVRNKRNPFMGRPTVFTPEEEEELKAVISAYGQFGQPLEKSDVLLLAQGFLRQRAEKRIAEGHDQTHSVAWTLEDDKPGRGWFQEFKKRHPTLKFGQPKTTLSTKAQLTVESVQEFYQYFLRATTGVPPQNIVNADETCIAFTPEKKKVCSLQFVFWCVFSVSFRGKSFPVHR